MNSVIVVCDSCTKKNKIPADKQHLGPKCGHCGKYINMRGKAVPVELNDHNFHSLVKLASLPVMVDFFSPTCGPCKTMAPIVHGLAAKWVNEVIVATLDTSRNPQIASFFNIRAVPSFLFFKNGSLTGQMEGAVSDVSLEQKISSLL